MRVFSPLLYQLSYLAPCYELLNRREDFKETRWDSGAGVRIRKARYLIVKKRASQASPRCIYTHCTPRATHSECFANPKPPHASNNKKNAMAGMYAS